MNPKILSYVRHYTWALFASGFNGGVTSVVAVLAVKEPLVWANIWPAFELAFVAHAFLFLSANPLPVPTLPPLIAGAKPPPPPPAA